MGMSKTLEEVSALTHKIRSSSQLVLTEEATKNAFVMPFMANVLGYDVFDPSEIVPEFTCDHGTKRGEKVDYAVVVGGQVQMIIEAKAIGTKLDVNHASQLYRYFSVTTARIGILTNGQVWQFFTDSTMPNRMDDKPFLTLDLLDVQRSVVLAVSKLSKSSFDLDSVIRSAEELRYVSEIRAILNSEFSEASDDLTRWFMSRIYDGRATSSAVSAFKPMVTKAMRQHIESQVSRRLSAALDETGQAVEEPPVGEEDEDTEEVGGDIITTDEELEAYRIVRTILSHDIEPERIVWRDNKTYFTILLDDNNRKQILRCHFNSEKTKYLTLLNEDEPVRQDIGGVEEIYLFKEQIRDTVSRHERESAQREANPSGSRRKTIADLIDAGLVKAGDEVFITRRGVTVSGHIDGPDGIKVEGEVYPSPSLAGLIAINSKRDQGSQLPSMNGWAEWRVGSPTGSTLSQLRDKLGQPTPSQSP